MKVQVVGFDPAFRNFGIAQAQVDVETLEIEAHHIELVMTEKRAGKTVRKNSDELRRCREIHASMLEAARGMTIAVAEIPEGAQNASAAKQLGMVTGVLAACPLPLIEVNPREVKLATVGKKTATKDEMIEWAMERYPTLPWLTVKRRGEIVPTKANEHLADAIAVIHAGVLTEQFRASVSMLKSMSFARSA